jgi:ATP-dependent helicase/nuclease subunit A
MKDALEQARRLFALALETPGGLKINTIHAFCQTLLSRFPLEAGIPPFFQVLDDQTADRLMQDARNTVLARAATGDRQVAAAIAFIAEETSEAQLNEILQAALGPDRRKLEAIVNGIEWHVLRDRVRSAHGAGPDDYRAIMKAVTGGQRMQAARWHEIVQWLSGGSSDDQKMARQLARMLEENFTTEHFRTLTAVFMTQGRRRVRLVTANTARSRPDLMEF